MIRFKVKARSMKKRGWVVFDVSMIGMEGGIGVASLFDSAGIDEERSTFTAPAEDVGNTLTALMDGAYKMSLWLREEVTVEPDVLFRYSSYEQESPG